MSGEEYKWHLETNGGGRSNSPGDWEVDPGTGSLLAQTAIASLLTFGLAVKFHSQKTKTFIRGLDRSSVWLTCRRTSLYATCHSASARRCCLRC